MNEVFILGAEEQAATSIALAYPDRRFLFISDHPVVDGWDLPNVSMVVSTPDLLAEYAKSDQVVPLSARWLPNTEAFALTTFLPKIDAALQISANPIRTRSIAKGCRWHRPDAVVSGTGAHLIGMTDVAGEGLVFQEMALADATIMVVGRRWESGLIKAGCFRVLQERFFRIDVLQASESIENPQLIQSSMAILERLQFVGWFTFNWLLTQSGLRLSSFRPAPKALFGCFRRGDVDLLGESGGASRLRAGLKTVAYPHYASFEWLRA